MVLESLAPGFEVTDAAVGDEGPSVAARGPLLRFIYASLCVRHSQYLVDTWLVRNLSISSHP